MVEAGGIEYSGSRIALRGEFDLGDLEVMRMALSAARCWGRPTLVDLSGVTFLDATCTRELATWRLLRPDLLTLHNPSWQALRSLAAYRREVFASSKDDV